MASLPPGRARRVCLFFSFVCVGIVPAALALHLDRQPQLDPWIVTTVEARARAAILDAHTESWLDRCSLIARELSSLLRQLGAEPIGHAAEGTLVLRLQDRLREHKDIGELSMVNRQGRLLLSTDGTRVTGRPGPDMPEVAQAAQRPALVLTRDERGTVNLAVAAPVWAFGDRETAAGGLDATQLRGILVARLKASVAGRLLRDRNGLTIRLVDGNGLVLAARPKAGADTPEDLRRLGSESRPGRLFIDGRPSAYVPLRAARAAIVASGSLPPPTSPWRPWHLAILGAVLLFAAVATWLFATSGHHQPHEQGP